MDSEPASAPAATPREIELKFAIRPADLRRLIRHPMLVGRKAKRQALVSTYFDTPDLALHRRSLTLRVRKIGRRYVQTVKADDGLSIGGLNRPEWETPLAGSLPSLADPLLEKAVGKLDESQLVPVFTSRVQRTTRIIQRGDDTVIEVAYDKGQIETASASGAVPVSELECELKAGSLATLFEVACALSERVPLRLEARSKSARGYALVAGDAEARTPRFGKVELARDIPAETALASIAAQCVRQLLGNGEAALAGDIEGVHQMRVALRRLRATLSLFKTLIPDGQRRWAVQEMKRFASMLGEVRNWDVLALHVAPVVAAFPDETSLQALQPAIRDKRAAAFSAMRDALDSARYTDFLLRLLAWIETRGWREQAVSESSVHLLSPVGELADALLERHHRKARKLAKRFAELSPGERHKLRIALKKVRYTVDALRSIYPGKATKPLLKHLSSLQDAFGTYNDIATMNRLLAELPPETGSGAAVVRGWYGHVMRRTEAKLSRQVARFLKTRPFWARDKER